MRAIQAVSAGGPEVLELCEVAVPQPGPGHLLVRVLAAGVNFIDTYQRSGVYPMAFPHVPGSEGAGIVEAVGSAVSHFKVGELVAWAGAPGSYAELALVPESAALRVPEGLSPELAAALPLQGLTAHYLLRSSFPVGAGTKLLITAGAGGVGRLAIQLAKHLGAYVITTVGTDQKAAAARAAGADHVIVLTEPGQIPEIVRRLVPGGLDVVYDGLGKDTFDATISCLRPRGSMILFGGASGQVPPFDLQRLNSLGSLFVQRPTLAHHTSDRAELEWRAGELFGAVSAGWLDVKIGLSLPLERAADAHRALEERGTTGKVILTV